MMSVDLAGAERKNPLKEPFSAAAITRPANPARLYPSATIAQYIEPPPTARNRRAAPDKTTVL